MMGVCGKEQKNIVKHPILTRLRCTLALFASILFLAAGCSLAPSGEATPTLDPTNTLPPPQVLTTSVPPVQETVAKYLNLWQAADYEAMYAMLTSASRAEISLEDFSKRYQDVLNETASNEVKTSLSTATGSAETAAASYSVTLPSAIFGDLSRESQMNLVYENGEWRVAWDATIILPELAGGNTLKMDRELQPRAAIYDRNGAVLAAQVQAASIGIWTDFVDLGDTRGLLSLLSTMTQYRADTIRGMIEVSYPGSYLALGEVPLDEDPRRLNQLRDYGAVVVSEYASRLYYRGGIGPHIVGYVSALQEEEVSQYQQLGYPPNARVGRKGIEQWGENILAGKPGGALYVFDAQGKPLSQLGATPSQAGQSITTTLDADLQAEAQKAMSVFSGAIVVMERETGRVLAMVSTPGFNPNAYEFENYNWNTLLNEIVNNPKSPQFNRATNGQYPLGSVFKVVTMAAALESERFTAESEYDCQYVFDELGNFPRYDWTWDHFQEDGKTKPSGLLTLPQGLIRSCNPWFWHIGLDLFDEGLTTAISDMSKGFGLGAETGIEVVDEEPGVIPDPGSQVDAVNLAIGQGDMLVTPLQVARFMAAMGNGGTLYRPQVIESINNADGSATFTFQPEVQGELPLSPENLLIITEAMKGVTSSKSPMGTAYLVFAGFDVPIAGKTGSATAPEGESHAWFAGYTYANQAEKPDIAVAVIAENSGEGSEIAAPIFRRIIELYFYGRAIRLYPWEAAIDVTRSPTVPITDTPTPQQGLNP